MKLSPLFDGFAEHRLLYVNGETPSVPIGPEARENGEKSPEGKKLENPDGAIDRKNEAVSKTEKVIGQLKEMFDKAMTALSDLSDKISGAKNGPGAGPGEGLMAPKVTLASPKNASAKMTSFLKIFEDHYTKGAEREHKIAADTKQLNAALATMTPEQVKAITDTSKGEPGVISPEWVTKTLGYDPTKLPQVTPSFDDIQKKFDELEDVDKKFVENGDKDNNKEAPLKTFNKVIVREKTEYVVKDGTMDRKKV